MIYTVTLNPSIDYVIKVDNLETAKINRVNEENVYPGGKGINVSQILKEHGYTSKALGFISGFTGEYIVNILREREILEDFTKIESGFTRINVKVKSKDETEINGQGPKISTEDLNKFYGKLEAIEDGDVLVLAGSIPKSLESTLYENIMKKLQDKDIKVVVDATQDLLLNVLKYNPFLIKPNNHELEEIFDVKLNTLEDIKTYAMKLKDMGAQNVLVSLGKDGALLITENNEVYVSNVGKGQVVNSVGAGDSMVAGFIAGYLKNHSFEEALKLGAASGSATAFSSDLAKKDFIDKIYEDIKVERR